MKMKHLYILLMVAGTILPMYFFIRYFNTEGPQIIPFLQAAYTNDATSGFAMDLAVSGAAFFIWSFVDANRMKLKK